MRNVTSDSGRQVSTINSAKRIFTDALRHENSVLGLSLVILIIILSVVTNGMTTRLVNLRNVLAISSMRGMAAVGQAFVIITGGIDLSVGGIALVAGIAGAQLLTAGDMNLIGHPVSLGVAVLVILLVGAAWGAVNGLSVSRIGMPALIVTLAMWEVTTGVAFQICGGRSIAELPSSVSFFGLGGSGGVSVPIVIWLTTCVIAYLVLAHTTFGRSLYAVGGNPVSSWLSGLDVRRVRLLVYVISGFLAGIASMISMGRVMSFSMNSMVNLELDSIASVCIGGVSLAGGRGSMIGVVLGVLIIGIINNGMSVLMVGPAVEGIVKGGIIFGSVAADYVRHRR